MERVAQGHWREKGFSGGCGSRKGFGSGCRGKAQSASQQIADVQLLKRGRNVTYCGMRSSACATLQRGEGTRFVL